MIFILIATGVFIIYFLFNMVKNSFVEKNYWVKCEKDYYNLLKKGYDKKSTLMGISKQSHPE